MAGELTTTSYAILGLLALRPWTTYELAQQMRRALGDFWPRAESNLYAEPKKLVALRMARASTEKVGQRPRTVYTITAKGRRALEAWMPQPGAGPVVEFELLIKVFFAEFGTKADLEDTIERARQWAEDRLAATIDIPRSYLRGDAGFPDRLPWILLSGEFLKRFTFMVAEWAEWAADVVEDWPDDVRDASPHWPTLENMARDADSYIAAAAAKRRGPASA